MTSGIGVPGDSGAWLIRRSDNGLMGLIWGRNHDRGDPLERVRLTYFTPIVDILADVRERHAAGEEVALPAFSASDLEQEVEIHNPHEMVPIDMSQEPWSVFSREAIRRHRQIQADLILDHFVGEGIPASGPGLEGTDAALSLPGLSASSSVRSESSSAVKSSEVSSEGNGVHIVGDGDADMTGTTHEPIRSKAIISPRYPGVLNLNQAVSSMIFTHVERPEESHEVPDRVIHNARGFGDGVMSSPD